MNELERIVRLLAGLGPDEWVYDKVVCAMCGALVAWRRGNPCVEDGESHGESCPYGLAVAWVAENPSSR